MVLSSGAVFADDLNSTESLQDDAADSIDLDGCDEEDLIRSLSSEDDSQSVLSSNESSKNKTELVPSSNTLYPEGMYNVTLKDSDSNTPISNKTVNLLINNVAYANTTNENGVAVFNLILKPGKYSLLVNFTGDDTYENSNLTASLKILPTVTANDVTTYYKSSAKYSAKFYDNQGNCLSNANIALSVNGKTYNVKTNSAGIAYFAMNLKPGTYKIIATNPATGYNLTTTFKILSTIGTASNLHHVKGDTKKVKVKLLKSNGKALANKYVKYKLKGKTYKVKTDSNGIMSFYVKSLNTGTYTLTVYNADGLSKTYKIKIYCRKASTTITAKSYTYYMNQTKKFVIKFSTRIGENSTSGKTIKIKLNGKTYSRKTDSNGVINFNVPSLKKGFYTVEYKYEGNKYFKASKATKFLTLIDTRKTALKVKGTKSFGYGAGTSLKVIYTAGGVPLANKDLTLNVNGVTYGLTTDKSGIASIPINLKIGTYEIGYETENLTKVDGTSGSFNISVFKRSPSKIVWKCGNSYKDNSQVFRVLVTNSKGQHVSGGKIKLTIDSNTYSSTVSSKGYAKFTSYVAIGKYKIKVKYNGNNNYLQSSKSKYVTVKLSKFRSGVNEKQAVAHLSKYLKSSKNCKVKTAKLKSLVKSLTSGKKNKVNKARALFNYVRDNIDYCYYYDTYYGASKTLKYKEGNCVDQAHLLVALYRTAGFKARYVHGICKFSDGDVTGHVWAQVKIGKYWVCADPISYRNSLGKVKNWDINSFSLRAKYRSLPF